MIRIAVVTPLCPTLLEPYRGSPISQTVLALQQLAEVNLFYPQATFPRLPVLQPRKFLYSEVDRQRFPAGIPADYIPYPAFPLLSRPFNGKTCARYLLPYLEKAHPEVILAYWLYPEGYGALLAGEELGIPVILGARGSDLPASMDRLTARLLESAVRKAACVLTVSEELRQRAIRLGGSVERVRTVPNGCDSSQFYVGDRNAARAELGFDPNSELVLFVGRLNPVKGLADLMEAAGRLVPAHPMLQLVLIGEGPLDAELRARASRSDLAGHVRFLGRQPQRAVTRWLAASNLLCLPSYSEGCPNVVLEALSCGRPVVATAVGATPELVGPECGITVPSGDIFRLHQAIDEALHRLWDCNFISRQFSRTWGDVADETYEVCLQVLQQSVAPAMA